MSLQYLLISTRQHVQLRLTVKSSVFQFHFRLAQFQILTNLWITKVVIIHTEGEVDLCTNVSGNPSSSCRDISVLTAAVG